MMRAMPITENLFEKKVEIKRIDIFQVDTNEIETFLNGISVGDKKEITQIADDAVEGKIKGFSSIELNYGKPINWHLNPITKIEVDKKIKWYKIPDFDCKFLIRSYKKTLNILVQLSTEMPKN
jgi:hypothetical protein